MKDKKFCIKESSALKSDDEKTRKTETETPKHGDENEFENQFNRVTQALQNLFELLNL